MVRYFLGTLIIMFAFTSCKKDENDSSDNSFVVTYDGALFHCTGFKSFIEIKDLDRLNLILDLDDKYSGNVVGLVDLKGDYKKDDKIKVSVAKYNINGDKVCPAFTPFPSVVVLKEELIDD